MQVLSIGTDRKLFEDGSSVLLRNIEYASKTDRFYIIVFSLKKLGLEPKFVGNLYIYPTNSVTRMYYIFDAIRLGKKLIKENKLIIGNAVISTQDPFETGLVGYFLKRRFNLPLQLQVHTDFLSSHFANTFLNKIRIRLAKFLIPRAQGLRVVSKVIEKSIQKNFSKLNVSPQVLPVFVDVENIINTEPVRDINKDFPQFKFIIFMASRLTQEKRIDIALQAFKKVVNQFPYVGLIIAGDGGDRIYLENLTKKLELSDKVVFVGWQKDLISYYKTTNIFLLSSEYEGYGMTLIEAGASGCPIITTKVGIADTSLFVDGYNSSVCPINDVDCIFKAILELIMDNTKKDLFKQRMRDSIKSSFIVKEEYTKKYVDLLENLIK
jgi:glycosyltransferase involved in cell wall biosynthesis